ncbi:hypothetical protein AGLY_002168 [Aphis glycines]|uniref:Uncharacterized protein n=1 Tax=Aphis glycines TaxID=307491 RepID=A0A6G0U2M7_APHGL|nr:hypothetical protein AGLY_002168 [Aphis glycines]
MYRGNCQYQIISPTYDILCNYIFEPKNERNESKKQYFLHRTLKYFFFRLGSTTPWEPLAHYFHGTANYEIYFAIMGRDRDQFRKFKSGSQTLKKNSKRKVHEILDYEQDMSKNINISCETRMKKNITIDKQNLALIRKETEHWRAVLTQRNLAFRGKSDTLFTSNNDNFLGLIEMLGKFDPKIIEHIRRIQSKEIHDHYLGKSIQN